MAFSLRNGTPRLFHGHGPIQSASSDWALLWHGLATVPWWRIKTHRLSIKKVSGTVVGAARRIQKVQLQPGTQP